MAVDDNLGRFAYLPEMVITQSKHFDDSSKTFMLTTESKVPKLHTKSSLERKVLCV